MSTAPSASRSQRDTAYETLRRLVILQQINDGERLREPEWSERLGVNRAALREAFARLEAEGLIERGPKTGYFVPTLSEEDIREILQVRTALEGAAIEQIIREKRNSPANLRPLREAIDHLDDLITKGYLLGAGEADRRFHEALIELSGNRRLAMIYARAPLPMIHARIVRTPQWEPEMRRTLAEHQALIVLIARGEIERAKQLLGEHLDAGYLRGDTASHDHA